MSRLAVVSLARLALRNVLRNRRRTLITRSRCWWVWG